MKNEFIECFAMEFYYDFAEFVYTEVNRKVLPVLSTETLLRIWLSTENSGFRSSSTAVDTVSLHAKASQSLENAGI